MDAANLNASTYTPPPIDWQGSASDAAKIIHERNNPADRVWLRRQETDFTQRSRHFGTVTKDNKDEQQMLALTAIFLREIGEELSILAAIERANEELRQREGPQSEGADYPRAERDSAFWQNVRERTLDLADKFFAKLRKDFSAEQKKHGYKGREADLRGQAALNVGMVLRMYRNTVLIEELTKRVASLEANRS